MRISTDSANKISEKNRQITSKMNLFFRSTVLVLFCGIAGSLASGAENNRIRIPLHRAPSALIDSLSQFNRQLNAIKTIRGAGHHASPMTIDKVSTNLVKYGCAYMARISLGWPSQDFVVGLWSGKPLVAVPAIGCLNNDCKNLTKYNARKSSSYKKDGRGVSFFEYNLLEAAGRLSIDDLQFGALTISGLLFVEMSYFKPDPHTSRVEGLFGLNSATDSIYGLTSPIELMFKQNQINKRVFSIYWNETSSSGEISFGEPDTDKGTINYGPVSGNDWQVSLHAITVNGTNVLKKPLSTYLTFEFKQHLGFVNYMQTINLALGAKKAPHIGPEIYEFDCDKLDQIPELAFHINQVKYVQKLSSIVAYETDSVGKNYCLSNFIGTKYLPSINLGASFIGPHYSVFDIDQRRVGFVQ